MPDCYPCFYQAVPALSWPGRLVQEKGEWGWQPVLDGEQLEVIAPGGGGVTAHLQNIHNHFVDCGVLVTPDVVEDSQGIDV